MSLANATSMLPLHPYYPLDVELIGYLANEWDSATLLSMFAASCLVIFSATWVVVGNGRWPELSTGDFWATLWFVMCGCIHICIEGYFIYNFKEMPSKQDILGQMWKVYSLSDSRYQTQDAFVLCMETITAVFWGPLSFLLAFLITAKHPLRHPFQIIVSLGQFYGDVLYYATNMFDEKIYGLSYSRPEAAIFWGLYVFLNAFWIVIPAILVYESVKATAKAFAALEREQKSSNGAPVPAKQNGNAPRGGKKNL